MLYNTTRLEIFLQLRLCITCLCGTALRSLPLCNLLQVGWRAPCTWDRGLECNAKATVLRCRKSVCHHSKPILLQGPLPTSSVPSRMSGMHPLQSHSNTFLQLGTSVASPHLSEDKRIKGSNAGARIQSTASEGQTGPSQKRNLYASIAKY